MARSLAPAAARYVNVADEITVGARPEVFARSSTKRTKTQRPPVSRCSATAFPANESTARVRTVKRRAPTLASESAEW